jgi:uncharacterized protein (DUF433 family)
VLRGDRVPRGAVLLEAWIGADAGSMLSDARTGDEMHWQPYITTTPDIFGGKPIVQGTRLTVDFVLGLVAAGWSPTEVLENYPNLSAEALRAVFAYSAEVLQGEALYTR